MTTIPHADLLRTFHLVASTGSATAAGHMLGLSPAGVTYRIRRLATLQGSALFYRPGYTRMTRAGKELRGES